MEKRKRTQFKLYLTPDIEARVRAMADDSGENISAVLRQIIRVGLNLDEPRVGEKNVE